ncbi:hypothetical protein D3C76_1310560 [compost metagenome]
MSLRRPSPPRMSHWVGVKPAKTRLQFSAQVSATHITPREQASFRCRPGRTNLSRAMASIGPIRIRVFSKSNDVVAIPVSSGRMAPRLLVRVDARHDTQSPPMRRAVLPGPGLARQRRARMLSGTRCIAGDEPFAHPASPRTVSLNQETLR